MLASCRRFECSLILDLETPPRKLQRTKFVTNLSRILALPGAPSTHKRVTRNASFFHGSAKLPRPIKFRRKCPQSQRDHQKSRHRRRNRHDAQHQQRESKRNSRESSSPVAWSGEIMIFSAPPRAIRIDKNHSRYMNFSRNLAAPRRTSPRDFESTFVATRTRTCLLLTDC